MFILSEDSQRTHGKDAQTANIAAGKAVAESVRTTLGPRGMDKMIVEVAETQEDEVGDGTTTASVVAGRLLAQAEDLLEQDVHPTTIVEGYHQASSIASDAIDEIALDVDVDDELLAQVAESSMTGKGTGGITAAKLATTVVDAVRHVEDDGDVDGDSIYVTTQVGASSSATELVEGFVLDEEPTNPAMPRTIEDASIAVLDFELGVRSAETDMEYQLDSVDQLNTAMESEDRELRKYVEALADAGADVVFTTEDVDDRVSGLLEGEGILAYESVDDSDARAIARATGATVAGTFEDFDAENLGAADDVYTEIFGGDEVTFVEGGAAARAVTVFVRGGTEHVVDELERALGDAIDVVTAALQTGEVVPGAGATEIAIAHHVREEAAGIEGRRQLAVEAFADAIDVIPRTLAENAGEDPIDALVDLRAAYEDTGRAGLVAHDGAAEIVDPVEYGVLDAAAVKHEAIGSATEAATMIARIDDVIAAN